MKRTATATDRVGNFRVTKFSDGSASVQYLAKGEIISINDKTPAGENSNGNAFYIAQVKAMVEGKEKIGSAIIWESAYLYLKGFPEILIKNLPVDVAINDVNYSSEGEEDYTHKGKAAIEITDKTRSYLQEQRELAKFHNEEESNFRRTQHKVEVKREILNSENLNLDIKNENTEQDINLMGCFKIVLVIVISAIIMTLAIAPISFLGEILYPLWVIGVIFIAKFLAPLVGIKE